MGFGGEAKAAQQQFNNQLLVMQTQRQQLDQEQAKRNADIAQHDAEVKAKAEVQQQQDTAVTQQKSKLSIFDAITTSPAGLLNQPKTGRLTLFGN